MVRHDLLQALVQVWRMAKGGGELRQEGTGVEMGITAGTVVDDGRGRRQAVINTDGGREGEPWM